MQEEVEQKGSNMHIGWTIKAEIQRTLHMKTSPWHSQLVEVWKTSLRSIETEQTTDKKYVTLSIRIPHDIKQGWCRFPTIAVH